MDKCSGLMTFNETNSNGQLVGEEEAVIKGTGTVVL